ncbi:uncharacterized protein BDR25DRAFT_309786 [Lindgomyces ingoldianus]|uniref:Uncharacterized protein n=1 Tax=Lindgomyces ingoldianus TaxID=673940 RepID=A0ACB6RB23_9PLEO|nr:uncharacterized protein BDR25DRAFT_309786 [Lindgomyces ingoldianus]KAF2476386.1 hypothetical protein BDR25DRAFT_309786 [Lindgomyces ingoldianus]
MGRGSVFEQGRPRTGSSRSASSRTIGGNWSWIWSPEQHGKVPSITRLACTDRSCQAEISDSDMRNATLRDHLDKVPIANHILEDIHLPYHGGTTLHAYLTDDELNNPLEPTGSMTRGIRPQRGEPGRVPYSEVSMRLRSKGCGFESKRHGTISPSGKRLLDGKCGACTRAWRVSAAKATMRA